MRPGARLRYRIRFGHVLAAVCLLALVVRLVVIAASPAFRPNTDAADYDRIAVSLAEYHRFPTSDLTANGGPTAFRTPLFPTSLAVAYKLVGVSDAKARWRAGRVMEAFLGTLAVLLIALIARQLWGDGIALASSALAAIYPPLLLVGSSLMSESLFVPLVLGAVLAALEYRKPPHRVRWLVLTGVLAGCAGLTRGNGIFVVVPLTFLVWIRRPRLSFGGLRSPALMLLVTAATLLPWTLRNLSEFHSFVPLSTELGFALDGTYNKFAQQRSDYPSAWLAITVTGSGAPLNRQGLNEAQLSNRLSRVGFDYIGAHPASVAKTVFWNTFRLLDLDVGFERYSSAFVDFPAFLTYLSVYTFWLVGLLALAGCFTAAARRAPAAFWACPLALAVPVVFVGGAARIRAPADPFLLMLAALALAALCQHHALGRQHF